MQDFIEVSMAPNGGKLLISVSSISLIEEFPNNQSRVCLKEKTEMGKDVNVVVIVKHRYEELKKMIYTP
jgi:hypothetical protein